MLLIDASQQLWMPSLLKQDKVNSAGIKDWFYNSSYRIEDQPKIKSTKLYAGSSHEFNEAMAQEILKYATASFESIKNLEPIIGRPKASGWILIRSYYAAYFAANCLMRMFGSFCVYLDNTHISEIHNTALLYNVKIPKDKHKLRSGTYFGTYDESTNDKLIIISSLESRGGGAHQQFWSAFKEFLIKLRTEELKKCTLPKKDIETIKNEIFLLQEALSNDPSSKGTYLSDIRNSVNYRLEQGVWHPYSESTTTASELISILEISTGKSFSLNLKEKDPEIKSATIVSSFLVNWLCHSLIRLDKIGQGSRKHFLRKGPLDIIMN